MRIIAGRLGGRIFESPRSHRTHPMSDKARGGLFNALGDIEGLTVLDAFAGSGALSFEAVSRGAAHVLAIDSDRSAQKSIAASIAGLDLTDRVKLVAASASAWLTTAEQAFDIILLDPPYDDLQPKLMQRLAERSKPSGIVVISSPPTLRFSLSTAYELLTTKNYGDAQLTFYRRRA